jgi:glyoxalase family protein
MVKKIKLSDMENKILGLHHIAIADSKAKSILHEVLGVRLVKKQLISTTLAPTTSTSIMNREDPERSSLFPMGRYRKRYRRAGMATHIGYAVPQGSLILEKSLREHQISLQESEIFGES